MTRLSASSSQLKAKLGKYMRAVRSGREVVVTDRGVPVARLVPLRPPPTESEVLAVAKPRAPDAPPLGEVDVKAIRYSGRSTTELLREDRERR